jgi:HSP20 family molecular chaperone IbpA|tara:strand:- start:118 stop:495 length:378 start_codon:yes stop_codon:yes gene_type:complete
MNINSTYSLVRDVSDLFNDLASDSEIYNWSHKGYLSSKIEKNEEGFSAKVEVPGYNKGNLSMKVENGNLLVVRSSKEEENDKVLYRLQLTKDIDCKNIKAKSQDGVLQLTLPAFTEKKSKCIAIE